MKKLILTSAWSAKHPNAGQNMQQVSLDSCGNACENKICFLRVDPQKSKSSFVSPTKNCWFGLRGFALWELQTNSFFHYSLALHVWQKNGLGTWNNWKLIPLFNKLKQAWSGSKLAAKQFKLSGKILMEMCQWHILSNIILAE